MSVPGAAAAAVATNVAKVKDRSQLVETSQKCGPPEMSALWRDSVSSMFECVSAHLCSTLLTVIRVGGVNVSVNVSVNSLDGDASAVLLRCGYACAVPGSSAKRWWF
jgi:hypothetical protein